MNILVCNVGSTSLKYQLFVMDQGETVLKKGGAERVGQEKSLFYTTDPAKTGTTALTYKKVEFLAGDVNMNGKIDANDYATIRKLVVGSLDAEDLSEKALELADVNGNGKIDANDYLLVKRHVLGTYTIPAWEDVE